MKRPLVSFLLLVVVVSVSAAAPILLPGGTFTVPAAGATGMSFVYSGVLTQNDTLYLTESGAACLQTVPLFCTNGAGVITAAQVAIGQSVSFSGTFNDTTALWTKGALLLEIQGQGTRQLFFPSAETGSGSFYPPDSLTLGPTTLASLGFASFAVVNPRLTFIVADTNYSDNYGQFVLQSIVPEPSTVLLFGFGSGLVILSRRGKRV